MTDAVQAALIISIAPTLGSIGAVVIAWLGRKQSQKNSTQIGEVHVLINNRMDQLLAAAKLESHAAGMVEGRQAGITERHDRVIESERVEDRAELKAEKK